MYANIDKIRSDGAFIAKGDNITIKPQIRTGDNDYKNFNWLVYNKYLIEINWMVSLQTPGNIVYCAVGKVINHFFVVKFHPATK